jgi:hypothetical protein
MIRNLSILALLSSLAPTAAAQDMPLSQILLTGEGWRKSEGAPPDPLFGKAVDHTRKHEFYLIGKQRYVPATTEKNTGRVTAGVATTNGATVYLGDDRGDILAYQVRPDGRLIDGEAYCQVRKPKESRQPFPITCMTIDREGRIYASTLLGVQVFDPTGRLCGVFTPAAPGMPGQLRFEGNELAIWIGEQKYVRKLNTAGAKTAKE